MAAKGNVIKRKKAVIAFLSVLPVVIIIAFVKAYPMAATFYRSFTNWDGMYKNDFVGLANYADFIGSGLFLKLLYNNLILVLNVPLQVIIGLFVAVLLYEEVLGWRLFRALYYVPQIISMVILGFLFKVFFGYEGPLNIILKNMGLGMLAKNWLASGATALPVMVICIVWFSIGWQAIVILGGMSSVPTSVFEAARLDGANFWQRTFAIVLPMMTRVIEYCVVMSVVWTFTGLFPLIYSMTKGGPGYETMTLDYMIYQKSFVSGNAMGMACAIAVILMIIVLIFTVFEMKVADYAEEKVGE